MSTITLNVSDYRYNQVREWQSELKTVIDEFNQKVRKYKRRVVVLDVIVYSVSAAVASAGLILSAITPVTATIAATICVSVTTTATGVFGIIAKKNSSCANTKLHNYTTKLTAATTAYSKLSSLISSSLDDETISNSEFKEMSDAYNDYLKSSVNNNGNSSITASTNSHKHNPNKNNNDLSTLDETRIWY